MTKFDEHCGFEIGLSMFNHGGNATEFSNLGNCFLNSCWLSGYLDTKYTLVVERDSASQKFED